MIRLAAADLLLTTIGTLGLTTSGGSALAVLDHQPTGAPNDYVPAEYISLGDIRGPLNVVHTRGANSHSYEDDFTVDLIVWSHVPGKTAFEARTRAGVLAQAVIDMVRADLTLGSSVAGLMWLQLGELDGPVAGILPDVKTGWFGQAIVTFNGKAHVAG